MDTNITEKAKLDKYHKEVELILACCRTKLDTESKNKIESLLALSLDWDYIKSFCFRNKVVPLVWKSLEQINSSAVPPETLAWYSRRYKSNTFNNILFASKLSEIIEAFLAEELAVIPFKGATLAISAYDNIGLRIFCDQDILIDEKNADKAIALLNKLGYNQQNLIPNPENQPYISSAVFIENQKNQKSLVFARKGDLLDYKNFFIELHWSLSDHSMPLNVDFDSLWKNRTYIELSGKKVPQFSPEDLLVYLCFHGSTHCWFNLKWVCDVNELICANPQLDWQKVRDIANKWNCRRMLYLGLSLSQNLLDTAIPGDIAKDVQQDNTVKNLSEQAIDLLLNTAKDDFSTYLFLLNCRERIRDKLAYLIATSLTPNEKDWHFLKLPKYLHYLYYLVRPYRLLFYKTDQR